MNRTLAGAACALFALGCNSSPEPPRGAASSSRVPPSSAPLPSATTTASASHVAKLIGPGAACASRTRFNECVASHCTASFAPCYGARVSEGILEGPCKSVGECITACSDEQATSPTKWDECAQACADEGGACARCLESHPSDCDESCEIVYEELYCLRP